MPTVQVLRERDNPLLGRREVHFSLQFDGPSPPRAEVRAALADALKTPPELLVLDHVESSYGARRATGYAKVYTTPERMKVIERPHILQRNFEPRQKKEKKKEEKKPEAPKETAKPEAKAPAKEEKKEAKPAPKPAAPAKKEEKK
ncbi:MAG: 30S ribosomal protein S24e [Euryarchaeota archaeon]|nr:30S ribosomal protein S24e [Euryarchaeota archaeon]